MSHTQEVKQIIREVEELEHRLERRLHELKEQGWKQRHVPGDALSDIFPAEDPPILPF